MNRRLFFAVVGSALWLAHATPSTPQDKIPRIGVLTRCPVWFDEQGFKQGLIELGYVEGKTILIEWRRFLENVDHLRPAADELVRSKVDVIVTCSTEATRAAIDATKTIPIVFTGLADPVVTGLAASIAKPGANATGVSIIATELYPKRLDLLQQLAPHARRVAFIVNLSSPGSAVALKPLQAAAKTLNIQLKVCNTRNAEDVESALRTMPWTSIDGLLSAGDSVVAGQGGKDRTGGSQGAGAGGVSLAVVSRVWCADVLRPRSEGPHAPGRLLRRQDSQGRQAC
jgi:putative ABC transport system substrate-binding protein